MQGDDVTAAFRAQMLRGCCQRHLDQGFPVADTPFAVSHQGVEAVVTLNEVMRCSELIRKDRSSF
jgi:hypothetical protein